MNNTKWGNAVWSVIKKATENTGSKEANKSLLVGKASLKVQLLALPCRIGEVWSMESSRWYRIGKTHVKLYSHWRGDSVKGMKDLECQHKGFVLFFMSNVDQLTITKKNSKVMSCFWKIKLKAFVEITIEEL